MFLIYRDKCQVFFSISFLLLKNNFAFLHTRFFKGQVKGYCQKCPLFSILYPFLRYNKHSHIGPRGQQFLQN